MLFDGVCNLCNGAVRFIFRHDVSGRFRFASLQSDVAAELLAHFGRSVPAEGSQSMALIQNGRLYERSDAALRVAAGLATPWSWARVFLAVPPIVRDAVYRFVAANRYRWFGKRDTCAIPAPEMRSRFL